MALRVLLADESSTIKKAIQMALSEYGVEVKGVPSGLDVLAVTHTFKPDIILADVLLTKKNGYEVCNEVKTDPATNSIPVILMWSSFMQIDQSQIRACKADGVLEKPFDTETLRALINRFVSKTQDFPLNGLLKGAQLPDFTESETFVRQRQSYSSQNVESQKKSTSQTLPPSAPQEEVTERTLIEDVEEDFAFDSKNLQESKPPEAEEEWSTSFPKDLGELVVQTENYGDFEEVTVVNKTPQSAPDLQKRIRDQMQDYLQDSPVAKKKIQDVYTQSQQSSRGMSQFDEQIAREEIRQVAERICWQIIPEITEKIVREELNKLLQGLEKHT